MKISFLSLAFITLIISTCLSYCTATFGATQQIANVDDVNTGDSGSPVEDNPGESVNQDEIVGEGEEDNDDTQDKTSAQTNAPEDNTSAQANAPQEVPETSDSSQQTTPNPIPLKDSCRFLKDFYSSLNGPKWLHKDKWDLDDTSCCSWYGVGCNKEGQIETMYVVFR
ncbi:hypothetical protein K7432_000384 [Basidiobolus ranarum]|uniref:Leucine-rich repeat-containing N-terminal plant-type domain-containing protein n=1 Tax=Basidiobolus ranarum TaxID=34480 RepID=A0ABR2WBA6_9FUNG